MDPGTVIVQYVFYDWNYTHTLFGINVGLAQDHMPLDPMWNARYCPKLSVRKWATRQFPHAPFSVFSISGIGHSPNQLVPHQLVTALCCFRFGVCAVRIMCLFPMFFIKKIIYYRVQWEPTDIEAVNQQFALVHRPLLSQPFVTLHQIPAHASADC